MSKEKSETEKGTKVQVSSMNESTIKNAMKDAIKDVIIDLADKLRAASQPLVPVDRGSLKQSANITYKETPTSFTATVGYNTPGSPYSAVMEFGRHPGGKFPPPRAIYEWLVRQGHTSEEAAKLTYPVSRKIAVHGIKAHRYLRDALKKVKQEQMIFMKHELRQAIKFRMQVGRGQL